MKGGGEIEQRFVVSPSVRQSVSPSVRPRHFIRMTFTLIHYTDDFYTYLDISGYWGCRTESGHQDVATCRRESFDSWASNGPLIPVLMTSLMTSLVQNDVDKRHQPVTSDDVVKMWQ